MHNSSILKIRRITHAFRTNTLTLSLTAANMLILACVICIRLYNLFLYYKQKIGYIWYNFNFITSGSVSFIILLKLIYTTTIASNTKVITLLYRIRVFFPAYFRIFSLFSSKFGLFRVNGSYFYPKLTRNNNHRFYFWEWWFFFGNLWVFSLRTMVLIKNECSMRKDSTSHT